MLIILQQIMNTTQPYNRRETIIYFAQKIRSGEIELPMVRKTLTQMGLEEQEIKEVVWQVDDIISKEDVRKMNKKIGREMLIAGTLTFCSGFLIIALFWVSLSTAGYVVVMTGSSGAGTALAIAGWNRMKK